MLLGWGWSQKEIIELQLYVASFGWRPDTISPTAVRFERFSIYRGLGLGPLRRAVNHADDMYSVVMYTDGSGTVSSNVAGIGVVIEGAPFGTVELGECIGLGSNNVAELTAIFRGLQEIPDRNRQIIVRSDSEYAIGSLTKNWNSKANRELILNIREDIAWRKGLVSFEHVRGHVGIPGNERADQLANQGRLKGSSL